MKRAPILALVVLFAASCATRSDIERLESKLDAIAMSTDRSTLEEIFGSQADRIRWNLEELSEAERGRYEQLVRQYQMGEASLVEVREQLSTLLGGGTREVSTPSGIYVRDMMGERSGAAIKRGERIEECVRLTKAEIPARILDSKALSSYEWGRGKLDGRTVLFPWDFTISGLTKEIVENTARRTAEELMSVGGSRVVRIQIVTERPEELTIESVEGADEVIVERTQR